MKAGRGEREGWREDDDWRDDAYSFCASGLATRDDRRFFTAASSTSPSGLSQNEHLRW